MKIWILTTETPWFNPGGIARYVDNFARYLVAEGHEVLVFGAHDGTADPPEDPGYELVTVRPKWELCGEEAASPHPDGHPAWPYNVLDYWGALSYQMAGVVIDEIKRRGPPDVIESQEYTALPYYLLQRKLTGEGPLSAVPVVVNAHSPEFLCRRYDEDPRYQFPHYWTGRLELFCLHAADSVICPSRYLSDQLAGLSGGSIAPIHFPLPWTDPRRFENQVVIKPRQALYYGRLEIRKGVLRMLQACRRLWKRGARFELHMIGSDTFYHPRGMSVKEWIERKYADEIGAGWLVIHKAMPFEALMDRVRESAFIVIPSIWENWPNTCIEAMSLGKVVVGSRHGGQAEMIGGDDDCGFLFSWDEEDGFEQAFSRALELDDGQRRAMGERARQRISGICEPGKVLPARLAHFESLRETTLPARFPFVNRRLRDSRAKDGWIDTDEVAGRVSVIIPHYNLGRYLEAAVDSAFASDWDDIEVVLVDDGSNAPDSLEVLERLGKAARPGLRIIRQENTGLAEARNAGVRAATGEFLLLLDADDIIEPGFIPRAVRVIRRFDNVHIVYSWERYIEASNDIYPCWNFELPYLLGHNMTCPVSLLYRRSYLTYGPSKPEMAYNFEDYELWINLVKNGCGGVALPDPLCRYRIRTDSMWQGSGREQHLHLQDLIVQFHPELFREYGGELFNLQNANGPAQKWIKPSSLSPFDEFEQWSRRRIAYLEKQTEKWWQHSVSVEERLQQAEREKYDIWREKNRIEERLKLELQRQDRQNA